MSRIFKRLISVVGPTTLEHVKEMNGPLGAEWVGAVKTSGEQKEKEVSEASRSSFDTLLTNIDYRTLRLCRCESSLSRPKDEEDRVD